VVVVGGAVDGKVNIVAAVTKDLVKRFHAGKLVQEVAKAAGGSGGGRPDWRRPGPRMRGSSIPPWRWSST
jgi:alanyl-tRNA synthetase